MYAPPLKTATPAASNAAPASQIGRDWRSSANQGFQAMLFPMVSATKPSSAKLLSANAPTPPQCRATVADATASHTNPAERLMMLKMLRSASRQKNSPRLQQNP